MKLSSTLLTVTQRRQLRTRRHSRNRPDTAALLGYRPSPSPCWGLSQKTTTAARPSWSSSSCTGPWRDTGSTGTRTEDQEQDIKEYWSLTGILILKYWWLFKGRDTSLEFPLWTSITTSWTHHINNLRARVSILLHGLAGTIVLSFTHQQQLLWVIHCQADLHMLTQAYYL